VAVLDLRTVSPLDKKTICKVVNKTGHLLVVDEDHEEFGLSGELTAVLLEANISAKYSNGYTQTTMLYAINIEDQVLPKMDRIITAIKYLLWLV
jgi:pyruvate dehydrogenase E1 component beta subunit